MGSTLPLHSPSSSAPLGLPWPVGMGHTGSPQSGEQPSPQLLQGLKHSVHQGVRRLLLDPVLQVTDTQAQSCQETWTRDSPPASPGTGSAARPGQTLPRHPTGPQRHRGRDLAPQPPCTPGPPSSGHSSRSSREAQRPSPIWGKCSPKLPRVTVPATGTHQQGLCHLLLRGQLKAASITHSLDGRADLSDTLHQGELELHLLRAKRAKHPLNSLQG